jgi:hypothetical protein
MSSSRNSSGVLDQHGNPFAGDRAAVVVYDEAIDRFLRFHPDVLKSAFVLATEHPETAMGNALVAYLSLTSTDAADLAGAREAWTAMGNNPMGEREAAHRRAIGAWLDGDWKGAASTLDTVLTRWPADLLALQVGHALDFFLGDAANLRDRPGRSLLELDPEHPHTAFVRGMHAFGLEESGHYGESRSAGLAAIETNPDDVWAIHAVVHTYEMQGRIDEGIAFLLSRRGDWGSGNLFAVHNWWHLAIYLLEAGDIAGALAIYDAHVHNDASDGVPLEMLDASALLWRLYLDGHDTGDRFAVLAEAWAPKLPDSSWYVFNDVHAVMAMVGAGREADAQTHIEALRRFVAGSKTGTNLAMTAEIGLPACEGIVSFAQGRYPETIDALFPIRRVFNHFGGSHAQRDALVRTMTEAALRTGELDLARSLIDERLSLRDTSVYGWGQRARLEAARGSEAGAKAASTKAAGYREQFAIGAPQRDELIRTS